MSIQQNVNQGMSIAALLYQHTSAGEEAQEVARVKRDEKRKTKAGRGQLYEGAATSADYREAIASAPENAPRRELMERAAEATGVAERTPTPKTRDAAEQAQREVLQSVLAGQEEQMAEAWIGKNTPPSSGLSSQYIKRFAKTYGYTYDAARQALGRANTKRIQASAQFRQRVERIRGGNK